MPTKTLPDAGTRSRRSSIHCCPNANASDPKLRFSSARRHPGPTPSRLLRCGSPDGRLPPCPIIAQRARMTHALGSPPFANRSSATCARSALVRKAREKTRQDGACVQARECARRMTFSHLGAAL